MRREAPKETHELDFRGAERDAHTQEAKTRVSTAIVRVEPTEGFTKSFLNTEK